MRIKINTKSNKTLPKIVWITEMWKELKQESQKGSRHMSA